MTSSSIMAAGYCRVFSCFFDGTGLVFEAFIGIFEQDDFYNIGTHFNNVLIWFTKRILGTVFLCPYNVCPK